MNAPDKRRRGALRWMIGTLLLASIGPASAAPAAGDFFQPFLGDLKSELDAARRDRKVGLVVVYEMDSCPFCERLHRSVLRDAAVRAFYGEKFHALRLDIKGDDSITGFDGKPRKESAFALQQKVIGTPTTVFYGLDGAELARLPGLPRDAAEYVLLGRYVAEGRYKTSSFLDWKRSTAK